MADRQFSHTLPKDFIFFPPNEPRTPNRPAREPIMPPRPGHSTHRIRRRRLERKPIPFSAPDIPVPSIELPFEIEAPVAEEWQNLTESNSAHHLEVPPRERIDPKTPPAQIYEPLEQESDWAGELSTPIGASINRPSSSCSNASDSSVSSSGSYASGPSYGGSCTSPETEIGDPFLDVSLPNNKENLKTPSKVRHLAPDFPITHRWATEMDNHLWDTYQSYLQDPTITPFKMLPGSLPPLGISHRVAREARKSWLRFKQKGFGDRETENTEMATKQTWPRSDSATRRRLKELCKRKYSIAPHYQRLLMSSSPSPPPELLAHAYSGMSTRPESSGSDTVPFSRDLGVSLVSETLPGSLPEGDIGNQVISSSSPAAAGSTASHQQTASSLAITRPRDRASSDRKYDPVPRLGSPFMYYTWGPSNSRRRIRSITPVTPHDTIHVTGSRLRSAMPPDLFSSPHKKRIVEDKTRPIEDPFVDEEHNPNQRRVRFRNRGVTISTSGSRDRLAQLFTPPSQSGSNASDNPPPSHNLDRIDLATPEGIKRLGSPFALDRPAARPRQYPRHAPSRSEPFILSGAQKWISPLLPNHNQQTGEITPNTAGETEPSEVENTTPVKQASPLP